MEGPSSGVQALPEDSLRSDVELGRGGAELTSE